VIKNLPHMVGNKFPVMAYIDQTVLLEIEEMRGDVPRSKFIGKLIQKSIQEAC
jgi:hypothetical protein